MSVQHLILLSLSLLTLQLPVNVQSALAQSQAIPQSATIGLSVEEKDDILSVVKSNTSSEPAQIITPPVAPDWEDISCCFDPLVLLIVAGAGFIGYLVAQAIIKWDEESRR